MYCRLNYFLSPNNPKREVTRTTKPSRIKTKWYTYYLAVL